MVHRLIKRRQRISFTAQTAASRPTFHITLIMHTCISCSPFKSCCHLSRAATNIADSLKCAIGHFALR